MEARELLLVIAPNRTAWQNGRIEQSDLFNFANSTCRLFGILDSVLEKELLKPLLKAYRGYRESKRSLGQADHVLLDQYEMTLDLIVKSVSSMSDNMSETGLMNISMNNAMTPGGQMNLNSSVNSNGIASNTNSMHGIAGGGGGGGLNNSINGLTTQAARPSNLKDVYSITQLKYGVEKAML